MNTTRKHVTILDNVFENADIESEVLAPSLVVRDSCGEKRLNSKQAG